MSVAQCGQEPWPLWIRSTSKLQGTFQTTAIGDSRMASNQIVHLTFAISISSHRRTFCSGAYHRRRGKVERRVESEKPEKLSGLTYLLYNQKRRVKKEETVQYSLRHRSSRNEGKTTGRKKEPEKENKGQKPERKNLKTKSTTISRSDRSRYGALRQHLDVLSRSVSR